MISCAKMALPGTLIVVASGCAEVAFPEMTNGQGEIAGEVTTTSVILQSRLTVGRELVEGDLAGAVGRARFQVGTTREFGDSLGSGWLSATPENDFIVKAKIDGLSPGTRYYYRLIFGPDERLVRTGPTRTFATLDGDGVASEVSFVVVTGMNYNAFHHGAGPVGGDGARARPAYEGPDKSLGFPGLETILDMKPNFFVATGDNVYYDVPAQSAVTTPDELRKKWHEQFVQPRFADLFAAVPTYWEKDDHDFRFNDSDNTGSADPSVELGIATFHEQVPVVDPAAPNPVTYRTHRINKDLQIWLVEGRDYRSPNMMRAGPGKTLWGAEQRSWLERTLLESDATFRILISPTPMIGPDDAEQAGRPAEGHDTLKRDNHSNPAGFQHERDSFFDWLIDNDFLEEQNFYIICGDRHWQYHSIHPTGVEEFSAGALVDANSRLGRRPGDPESNDPEAMIEQPYTQTERSGGFLRVTISPGVPPTATFRFHDEWGELLHAVEKAAR
jgi:alkaline phosphatase/alkaline phosphatase D